MNLDKRLKDIEGEFGVKQHQVESEPAGHDAVWVDEVKPGDPYYYMLKSLGIAALAILQEARDRMIRPGVADDKFGEVHGEDSYAGI